MCCFVCPSVCPSVAGKTLLRTTPQKRLNGGEREREREREIHLQIASCAACSQSLQQCCLLSSLPSSNTVVIVNSDTSKPARTPEKRRPLHSLIPVPVRRPSSAIEMARFIQINLWHLMKVRKVTTVFNRFVILYEFESAQH